MALSKALCLAILAVAATSSGAQESPHGTAAQHQAIPSGTEESPRDTAAQHHAWALKFAIDRAREVSWPPAPMGPLASSPDAEEGRRCVRSELVFDRMRLQEWRVGSCT